MMLEARRFFYDMLDDAAVSEGVKLQPMSATYVVDMLIEFIRRDALHCIDVDERGPPALVWLYKQSQVGDRWQRYHGLKRLGDVSLFVLGMFNDYVSSSQPGAGYYVDMGRLGYSNAASMGPRGNVLYELSDGFVTFVGLLSRVSATTMLTKGVKGSSMHDGLASFHGMLSVPSRCTVLS